jgi:hypothetical protein
MAFSPLPVRAEKPAQQMAIGKPKPITVLNKKPDASTASTPEASGTEAPPEDFADELNQQERNKYVKGGISLPVGFT